MSAPVHRVQVFPVDRALAANQWGWDCTVCRPTHIGQYGEVEAQAAADEHSARYPLPVTA